MGEWRGSKIEEKADEIPSLIWALSIEVFNESASFAFLNIIVLLSDQPIMSATYLNLKLLPQTQENPAFHDIVPKRATFSQN